MRELSRRRFMKMVGQGATALGIGSTAFSNVTWAQPGDSNKNQAKDTAIPIDPSDNVWEFYYPGKYSPEDAKTLNAFQAEIAQVNKNKGSINISDLVSGKLDGKPGISRLMKVDSQIMSINDQRYGANNPIFTDKGYARKTKYGDVIAFPMIVQPEVWPIMNDAHGFADYMLINGLNCTNNYYRPFYEGDTLYQVIDEQRCTDITPVSGSHYRTLLTSGTCKIYNQKGELVAESASILKDSNRRHKDPAKRNPSGSRSWESPEWWARKPHQYTDKDWEEIIAIWKNEKYRGAEPLYWDDVKIGDEPPPRAAGPFLGDEEGVTMLFNLPAWSSNIKKNVLDPQTFKKMVKNKQGIYVPAEYLNKKPKGLGSGNGMDRMEMPTSGEVVSGGTDKGAQTAGDANVDKMLAMTETSEIADRDWRAAIQNAVCPKWVAGMLINWIGDQGWLQRIGWQIMSIPPGYPESVIPPITKGMIPALFDKWPYLEQVPFMRGIRPAWHALEGDTIICRAYVTDKYSKNGEYFVDLIFWCHTLDRYIVEEGHATVRLPKKA